MPEAPPSYTPQQLANIERSAQIYRDIQVAQTPISERPVAQSQQEFNQQQAAAQRGQEILRKVEAFQPTQTPPRQTGFQTTSGNNIQFFVSNEPRDLSPRAFRQPTTTFQQPLFGLKQFNPASAGGEEVTFKREGLVLSETSNQPFGIRQTGASPIPQAEKIRQEVLTRQGDMNTVSGYKAYIKPTSAPKPMTAEQIAPSKYSSAVQSIRDVESTIVSAKMPSLLLGFPIVNAFASRMEGEAVERFAVRTVAGVGAELAIATQTPLIGIEGLGRERSKARSEQIRSETREAAIGTGILGLSFAIPEIAGAKLGLIKPIKADIPAGSVFTYGYGAKQPSMALKVVDTVTRVEARPATPLMEYKVVGDRVVSKVKFQPYDVTSTTSGTGIVEVRGGGAKIMQIPLGKDSVTTVARMRTVQALPSERVGGIRVSGSKFKGIEVEGKAIGTSTTTVDFPGYSVRMKEPRLFSYTPRADIGAQSGMRVTSSQPFVSTGKGLAQATEPLNVFGIKSVEMYPRLKAGEVPRFLESQRGAAIPDSVTFKTSEGSVVKSPMGSFASKGLAKTAFEVSGRSGGSRVTINVESARAPVARITSEASKSQAFGGIKTIRFDAPTDIRFGDTSAITVNRKLTMPKQRFERFVSGEPTIVGVPEGRIPNIKVSRFSDTVKSLGKNEQLVVQTPKAEKLAYDIQAYDKPQIEQMASGVYRGRTEIKLATQTGTNLVEFSGLKVGQLVGAGLFERFGQGFRERQTNKPRMDLREVPTIRARGDTVLIPRQDIVPKFKVDLTPNFETPPIPKLPTDTPPPDTPPTFTIPFIPRSPPSLGGGFGAGFSDFGGGKATKPKVKGGLKDLLTITQKLSGRFRL